MDSVSTPPAPARSGAIESVLATPAFAQYGPAGQAPPPTLAVAQAYCRDLTRRHYENFTVASWLLPRNLRQPFANVYSYCRWADDLADEAADPQQSLELLDWWQRELDACYAGDEARHPVFVALRETIAEFEIPREPLADLLVAFRQDQLVTRYETLEQLLHYCRYSANPVGRLVLYLGRCHNDDTQRHSDAICTGLQLANHWQDVARDYRRGRIYLPQEILQRFDCPEEHLGRERATPEFKAALRQQVLWAFCYFDAGWPLPDLVSRAIRVEVKLFLAGGIAILEAIQRLDYDVLRQRPTISRRQKLELLLRAMLPWKQRYRERGEWT